MINRVLRVLVVDDSAYVRKVISQMLSRSPFIEVVGVARDGADGLDQVEKLQPDVVTLDLIMPELDGLGFLRAQQSRRPVPVIVVSTANEDSELVLAALDAGAVDFIHKPTALATEKMFEISDELIEKVKAAAAAPQPLPALPAPPVPLVLSLSEVKGAIDIVVIGVSTGGPQALKYLIPQLPATLPVPIAMVLHMPVGYTEMYARKLNELCSLEVQEAEQGALVEPGRVLLAPGGRHLSLQRRADGRVVAHLDARPFDTPHRPAVDVLFQSAAELYNSRVLGLVLTGMGSDGQQGAAWIKARGGLIYTEAEQTCVVYGMPRAVAEAGLSDKSVPLTEMARAIVEVV